jgi:hypothetical protein
MNSRFRNPQLTFAKSIVSKANSLRRSLLSLLASDSEATPPEPVFPPARCWKSIVTQAACAISVKVPDDESATLVRYRIVNQLSSDR